MGTSAVIERGPGIGLGKLNCRKTWLTGKVGRLLGTGRSPRCEPWLGGNSLELGCFQGRLSTGWKVKAFPFDLAWAPSVDAESIAPQLFAFSIIPYSGFLYHLTKSKQAPPLALFGFYFLLVFVAVSIPAGIYAKVHYGTSLANVDWLHGGAEAFLTITNLLIVIGMRQGIREAQENQLEADTDRSKDRPAEAAEAESAVISE